MMLDTAKCVAKFCGRVFLSFRLFRSSCNSKEVQIRKINSSFLQWGLLGWGYHYMLCSADFQTDLIQKWPLRNSQALGAQDKHALLVQLQFCCYSKCWWCDVNGLPKQGFKTSNLLFHSPDCVVNRETELFSSTPFFLLHALCSSNVIVKEERCSYR